VLLGHGARRGSGCCEGETREDEKGEAEERCGGGELTGAWRLLAGDGGAEELHGRGRRGGRSSTTRRRREIRALAGPWRRRLGPAGPGTAGRKAGATWHLWSPRICDLTALEVARARVSKTGGLGGRSDFSQGGGCEFWKGKP
jgi:hypothetical protein